MNNDVATCSCLPTYIGSPPSCRPECIANSECQQTESCINYKCIPTCQGACGNNARCNVINHTPFCSCKKGETGDPFKSCYPIVVTEVVKDTNPCQPSPCGPNSICEVQSNGPKCRCVEGYIGTAPSCRPECVINTECNTNEACINSKCKDPCPGICGSGAQCHVNSHTVSCTCPAGYTGNSFVECHRIVEGEFCF